MRSIPEVSSVDPGALEPHDRPYQDPGQSPTSRCRIAADEVVVDQPRRLHQGIADRRADERETALLQILADRVGHGVRAGISSSVRQVFLTGRPSTNFQM